MRIEKISIKNFRSVKEVDITELEDANIFVGQNNHGKSNFLDAINWFFSGFGRGESKGKFVFVGDSAGDVSVEIIFSGLQEAIENMKHDTNKAKLVNAFGKGIGEIRVRRTTEFEGGKKRQFYNPKTDEWDKAMGIDNAWNDLLPRLEYVHTKVTLADVSEYKSKTPIAEMLAGVLTSMIESNPKYAQLKNKFEELFGGDDSEVKIRLNAIEQKVEFYLQKQFPDSESVSFNVDMPEFTYLLKNFSTEVDDGVRTLVEDKGDGMQRAVMLAIIQAYADFRRDEGGDKKFIFLIDEAELHLHPSAQRALKKALLDIAENGEQVFLATHSSVLVADDYEKQSIFKVEKTNKKTGLEKANEVMKMNIIYDLLGGSPKDLLLPLNFLIVEGESDFVFLDEVIKRFYQDEFGKIKILYAQGDFDREKSLYDRIGDIYEALDNPIYREKVVFLLDKPSQDKERAYAKFKTNNERLFEREQVCLTECETLEEYYPDPWKKTNQEAKAKGFSKSSYAKEVAKNILKKEQFEQKMPAMYEALKKTVEKGFE